MGTVFHSHGEPKFSDGMGVILRILGHQPGRRILVVYHQLGLSYAAERGGDVDGVPLKWHPDPIVVESTSRKMEESASYVNRDVVFAAVWKEVLYQYSAHGK